jgi:hypothetical protein
MALNVPWMGLDKQNCDADRTALRWAAINGHVDCLGKLVDIARQSAAFDTKKVLNVPWMLPECSFNAAQMFHELDHCKLVDIARQSATFDAKKVLNVP